MEFYQILPFEKDNQEVKKNILWDIGQWKLVSSKDTQEMGLFEKNLKHFQHQQIQSLGVVVSSPHQIPLLEKEFSSLYIPGSLSRQSDLLKACSSYPQVILEKGPFMAKEDILYALEKLKPCKDITVIDAGNVFGKGPRIFDIRLAYFYESKHIPWGIYLNPFLEEYPNGDSFEETLISLIRTVKEFGGKKIVYHGHYLRSQIQTCLQVIGMEMSL